MIEFQIFTAFRLENLAQNEELNLFAGVWFVNLVHQHLLDMGLLFKVNSGLELWLDAGL